MLVLTRRLNESILIGDNIEIQIVQVKGSGDQAVIRIGITAPRSVTVLRKEVYDEVVIANQQAVHAEISIPDELLRAARPTPDQKDEPPPDSDPSEPT
jgi:carbon storage regulator